jgi:alpha-D-ribose 1-methylphosphonate 5-triphosphate synthase subunit PhnH
MQAQRLTGGFATPAIQSAHAFRSVMQAMARPGSIQDIAGAEPPAPLSVAAGCVLLTLWAAETPVYLAGDFDAPDIHAWLAFHTGAPVVGPSDCMFAIGNWDALMPLGAYPIGSAEYPDRSATLIVEAPDLTGSGAVLRGPGIKKTAALNLPDMAAFQDNRALFPLGLDFIFTCGARLAALPRSTEVTAPQAEAEVI